ncbi:exonuclease SbcCD subunit D C-terminal domain-containing protein [Carboxylicivirga sp. N1Y90]|uniref:exonuclease SbcCD subunit D C-terminal domain-containing protein n=1 Tax=Carboxylicivirga fragile TaxID=3417571 RepID=UPI003D359745|nr:exonuclease SbcCD subunit D C-terminal domain-containing protein [Marinilabiliaceae bacterium N1Y90]
MKILHTSDWHLGHRLHEQSQHEEQTLFLSWLIKCINEQEIDVLLISGDIFDTSAPSSQSLTLYYNFLVDLRNSHCQDVIITGGNHDAPGTLNAPKDLLKALAINVLGKSEEDIKDEIIKINCKGEKLMVAAVPYLRDQDIRKAIAGESFDQVGDRYKAALIKHYNDVAECCHREKEDNELVIAMGHLFAIGGSTSDSEQTIYVGNAGDIGADDFHPIFDYIALGHLHRSQVVKNHIRYSGSPCILSFSEANHQKQLICIDAQNGSIDSISTIDIPRFRDIKQLTGDLHHCIKQLNAIDKENHNLLPWVEVVLDNEDNSGIGYSQINEAAEQLRLKVLKVSLKNDTRQADLLNESFDGENIKNISPMDVFKLRCDEQNFEINDHPDIEDAFHEVLQIARDN